MDVRGRIGNLLRGLTAIISIGAFLAGGVSTAAADDVGELFKQADKTLRQAEKLLHDGKAVDASKELENADELIKKIAAAEPTNLKLAQLKLKYEKIQKDVKRRLPKEEEKAEAAAKPDDKSAVKAAQLPRDAREAFKEFKDIQRGIEHSYRMIETSKTTEISKPLEDHYADIEKRIEELKKQLGVVREQAAAKDVTNHPDLDEAQAYIEEAPDRLIRVKAEMRQYAEEQAAREAAEKETAEREKAAKRVDPVQAGADWKELAALCKEYQDGFLSESQMKKQGALLLPVWNDWKSRFEPACRRFRERYGDAPHRMQEVFEGVPQPEGAAMEAWEAANVAYGIDPAKCEQQFAEWAASWGEDALGVSTRIEPGNKEKLELKYQRAEDALRYYRLAKEWNSAGDYDESIRKAKAAVQEALPLWKDVLKKLAWPGHNPDFAGPGDPDEIAKAALEFLRKNPKWSKPEYDDEHIPFAACVEGKGWEVWKRAPLTQEPTQYSVDVLVAFTGKADPEFVYVYHMVFYTAEAGGVRPGLPLHYANSKQYAKFRMLKEGVPETK